jgi:hypothetical protein
VLVVHSHREGRLLGVLQSQHQGTAESAR